MRLILAGITAGLFIACSLPAAYAEVPAAREAFKKGDYSAAYSLWLAAAKSGDASAQFNVAFMLGNGQGIQRDLFSAATWYDLAARQNYPHAKEMLEKTREEISELRQKDLLQHLPKADSGHTESQLALASLYASPTASGEDLSEALKWLLLAEESASNPTIAKRIKRHKSLLIKRMSEEEISAAEQRVLDWHQVRKPVE